MKKEALSHRVLFEEDDCKVGDRGSIFPDFMYLCGGLSPGIPLAALALSSQEQRIAQSDSEEGEGLGLGGSAPSVLYFPIWLPADPLALNEKGCPGELCMGGSD